jgi:DNA-binding transcriptional MerR regulator
MTVTVYISAVDDHRTRYNLDELASLGGVSRRTVRFYIQEGLLPAPLGVGRGSHYERAHLDRLLDVRLLQESGRSLDDIKTARERAPEAAASATATACGAGGPASARGAVARSAWRRLELAPGVELHVASDVRLPAPQRLDELVAWCRRHLSPNPEGKE